MKHCKYCGRDLPDTMFCHHPSTKDRLHTKCKDCQREYRRTHKPPPKPPKERKPIIKEITTPEEKARRMQEWRELIITRKAPQKRG